MATSGSKPISGRLGRLRINSTILVGFGRFTNAGTITREDTTDFECYVAADAVAWRQGECDVAGFKLSFSGVWNQGQNPHDSPPNLKLGARLALVDAYLDKLTARRFILSEADVTNFNIEHKTPGVARIDIELESQGSVTYATGSS